MKFNRRDFIKIGGTGALTAMKRAGVGLLGVKDMDDPLPGITESIGYFRGVLAGL